jgi:hypothetical protein
MSFWAAMDLPNIILLIRAINRMRIMILIKVNRLIHVQIQVVPDQVPSNAQIPAETRVPDQIPMDDQITAEIRVPDQIPTNAQIPAETRILVLIINLLFLLGLLCATDA